MAGDSDKFKIAGTWRYITFPEFITNNQTVFSKMTHHGHIAFFPFIGDKRILLFSNGL